MPSAPTRSDFPPSDSIPETLLGYDQWVCWTEKERDGKLTKIPVDPNTGQYASATDSQTWSSFEAARTRAERDDLSGLGFVFTDDDPLVGVDLDDCRVPETGTALDWAEEIVDTLESFTEVSPSGTGFHVIVEGTLPGDRSRKGDVEIYESARFFTMTGAHVDGTPPTIEARTEELETVYEEFVAPDYEEGTDSSGTDGSSLVQSEKASSSTGDVSSDPIVDLSDEALLSKARNAKNGEKFDRLWRGNTGGYESQSEADMALCALLAFWTGSDMQRMDRLFRDSGLMREKWDEVHFSDGSTYGEKTVERAAMAVTEHYEPDNASRKNRTQSGSASESEPAPSGDSAEIGGPSDSSVASNEGTDASQRRLLESIKELEAEVESLKAENEALRQEIAEERAARKALDDENSDPESEPSRTGFWSLLRR
jgi:primase-polymerase (primpol)-like protein